MKIGNRNIGPNEPPLIIAEIGINHGGDLNVAKNMVELIANLRLRVCKASNPHHRGRND